MQPAIPMFRISRARAPNLLVNSKSYVIVTKEGVAFIKERYLGLKPLDSAETKVYGFLLRLLSFGGVLPFALIDRWRVKKIFKEAQRIGFVTITTTRRDLPKNEVQDAIKQIWGNIPNAIYI